MTKSLLTTLLVTAMLLATGCGMFSKKSDKPKESSAIAGEVEETFRRRWVDKRAGELTAQGTEASAARVQAEREFQERYALPARKK